MIPTRCGFIELLGNYDPLLTLRTYNFSFYYKGDIAYLVSPGSLRSADLAILVPREEGNRGVDVRLFICSHAELARLKNRLGYFDVIKGFIEAAEGDPLLGCAPKYRGLRIRRLDPWMAAVTALMQQNTGFINAWRSLGLFIVNYSNIIRIFGDKVYIPFNAVQTLCVLTRYRGVYLDPDACIRRYEKAGSSPAVRRDIEKALARIKEATGMGYRADTLLRLAYAFASGIVSWDSPKKLAESLGEVKGFGDYSTRLAALLAFGKYRYPPLDQWTIRLASHAYGIPARASSVEEELVSRFGRHAGLAVYFLTVMLDAERYSRALARIKKGDICPHARGVTPLTLWMHDIAPRKNR